MKNAAVAGTSVRVRRYRLRWGAGSPFHQFDSGLTSLYLIRTLQVQHGLLAPTRGGRAASVGVFAHVVVTQPVAVARPTRLPIWLGFEACCRQRSGGRPTWVPSRSAVCAPRWTVRPRGDTSGPRGGAAQTTYTWNQPTSGGVWQTATNWLPTSGPPGVASDIAIFGNVATSANAVTLSGDVTIGELRFADVTSNSLTAAYTIGSSSQTITLNNGTSAGLLSVLGATNANQIVAANVKAGPASLTRSSTTGWPA